MAHMEASPPAALLAEARAFLRLEDEREDPLIAQLVRAATETVEALLGQLLIEREVREELDVRGSGVRPVYGPVRAVLGVERASDGGWAELPPESAEIVDGGEVRLRVPADVRRVRLRMRTGLGAQWNGVPEAIRVAVLRQVAHLHAHRDDPSVAGVPAAVRETLAPWRRRRL